MYEYTYCQYATEELAMDHQLDLPQGTMHVHERGAGPTLVFVSGLLVDHTLWEPVIDRLSDRLRCVALVLPLGGHRTAMGPAADLRPPGLARMVADALAALELSDVVLVGNDTGGAICQITAANHPERLAALVLTDCDAYERFLPLALRPFQWLARVPALADLVLRSARFGPVQTALVAPVNKRRDPARIRGWLAGMLADAGVRRDVIKVLAGIDARHTLAAAKALRRFHRPALLVWSREDRIFPLADARRLAADLPDARLEVIDGSRAFVPLDQPERLATLLAGFVEERVAVRAPAGPR